MKADVASIELNLTHHVQATLWPDFHNGNLNLDLLPDVLSQNPHLPQFYCCVINLRLIP